MLGSMGRTAKWLVVLALKLAAWTLILCIPLLGVWTASSMAAYANGLPWLALVAGLLAFPVLPLGWDLLVERRRRRKARERKKEVERILTTGDRLLVRTFVVNAVFVGALMLWLPQLMSNALSVRGDWFLDGQHGPTAERARAWLLSVADDMQWLWEASREDNPFDEMNEFADDQPPPPEADELAESMPGDDAIEDVEDVAAVVEARMRDPRRWPMAGELHPAVATMPAEAKTSIAAAARYLGQQELDPMLRVKALHDFVAQHVDYDAPALAEGRYPPQDAEHVFRTGIGVCAGYANLLVALGRELGVEIVYVSGHSRDAGGDISGQGHAWNAVKIEGRWHLIDATWNAGYVEGRSFTEQYSTDYLFTPPAIFALNHLPRDTRWQLLATPLTRGEFVRQVPMRPSFYVAGLELLSPTRSQVTVEGSARIELANPRGKYLMAVAAEHGQEEGEECTVTRGERVRVECALPDEGTYHVRLFVNDEQYGSFDYVGELEFNNSP